MASSVLSKEIVHRQKIGKAEAARKIAALVEQYMDARNFSEREKDLRIERFAQRIDGIIERRAKA
jgi:hypothetical protein